jgi:hypothetical protein
MYIGALGPFDVTIYIDGFKVTSKDHGDTVEITNIGDISIYVHVSVFI